MKVRVSGKLWKEAGDKEYAVHVQDYLNDDASWMIDADAGHLIVAGKFTFHLAKSPAGSGWDYDLLKVTRTEGTPVSREHVMAKLDCAISVYSPQEAAHIPPPPVEKSFEDSGWPNVYGVSIDPAKYRELAPYLRKRVDRAWTDARKGRHLHRTFQPSGIVLFRFQADPSGEERPSSTTAQTQLAKVLEETGAGGVFSDLYELTELDQLIQEDGEYCRPVENQEPPPKPSSYRNLRTP